ncbi:MAG: DUF4349 domain-containing protein [Geodermatophilaceae bacterium]
MTSPRTPTAAARRPVSHRRRLLATLLLVGGLALSACGGGTDSSSSAVPVAQDAGGSGGESAAGGGSGGESGGSSPDAGAPAERPIAPDLLDRAVIVTAEITVRSADVGRDADRATLAATAQGGQVSGDVRGGTGTGRTADLVLRVPPPGVDTLLNRLADLGTELSRSVGSRDVTTVVADVDSRVASLRASLDRLRALTDRASGITDLVSLERELTARESDLESLQAQQRGLADQVALATVSLHLLAEAEPVARPEQARGFGSGLTDGWDAFRAAGTALLMVLGATLPFLAVIALVAAVVLAVRRQRRPTAAPAGAGTDPS